MIKNSVINFYQKATSNKKKTHLELVKRSQLEVRVRKELNYESTNMNDVLPKRQFLFVFLFYFIDIF